MGILRSWVMKHSLQVSKSLYMSVDRISILYRRKRPYISRSNTINTPLLECDNFLIYETSEIYAVAEHSARHKELRKPFPQWTPITRLCWHISLSDTRGLSNSEHYTTDPDRIRYNTTQCSTIILHRMFGGRNNVEFYVCYWASSFIS
jgi:hypothetical protein